MHTFYEKYEIFLSAHKWHVGWKEKLLAYEIKIITKKMQLYTLLPLVTPFKIFTLQLRGLIFCDVILRNSLDFVAGLKLSTARTPFASHEVCIHHTQLHHDGYRRAHL